MLLFSGKVVFKLLISPFVFARLRACCSELDFEIIVFLRETDDKSVLLSAGMSDLFGFVALPLSTEVLLAVWDVVEGCF